MKHNAAEFEKFLFVRVRSSSSSVLLGRDRRFARLILLQAIKTRFSTILDSDESLLAAVTLPKFKLRWLRDETRKDTIKMTLAAQCRALTIEIPQKEPLQSPKSRDHENDLFAFPEEENQHDKQANTVDMEICEYLKSADMGNLHDFPGF